MQYDVIIIGAGITGSSIAMELSKYDIAVALIDKENDVAMKTTKANSGISHAGFDPKPGTKMARLNVQGNKMTDELAQVLNFHYKRIGSLVIGHSEEEHKVIDELYARGTANGVPEMRILKTAEEVHEIEPNLSPEIDYALYAPTAGIVAPWEMCIAFANTAVKNGVTFIGDCEVKIITRGDDASFALDTTQGELRAKYIINCAGTRADEIYKNALNGCANGTHEDAADIFEITPVKGEYYLLDKDRTELVKTVVFQTPTSLGKGVLISPTVHGNLIVGPDANTDNEGKDDVSVTSDALTYIRNTAARSVPNIPFGTNIRNFAGVRANVKGADDFIIGESPVIKGFINFAGIKSPGLTCAPAFGPEAKKILEESGLELHAKDNFEYYRLPDYFSAMSDEEKQEAIKENPRYGRVICRCETVTEAEIINAMHQPIPARTIDGVKRRTNAGMGRCQGGFCEPKVFKLLMDELGLNYDQVYLDKTGSNICVSETKEVQS